MSLAELTSDQILDSLCDATIAVAEPGDLEDVLQRLADSARRLIGAQYAAIGVPGKAGSLEISAVSGTDESMIEEMKGLSLHDGLLGNVLAEGRPIRMGPIAGDLSGAHPPLHDLLGVPIRQGEQTIGSLYLANRLDAAGFSERDQKVAETLAAHAAIAFRTASLLRNGREHEQQIEVLNRAAIAIAAELTLGKVLQQIVDAARSLVGAEYAALGVPNAEGHLEIFVHSGLSLETAGRISHKPRGLGLLGAIVRERRAIRLERLSDDPRSVGFPEGHPPMTAFLGVPIMAGEEMLGNLYLTDKQGSLCFSASDQDLVEKLAAHAAVALQNARLYEQVGRLAVVEERNRIGMDLHDSVIQSIYAVGLTLESTRLTLPSSAEESGELLERAIEGLNNTIRDIRNFILDLRPHRFRGDLEEGLARLVREFQANTMVAVSLTASPEIMAGLSTSASRTIFLTMQEALANVARHARAENVTVEIKRVDDSVEVVIVDDGLGFDTAVQSRTIGHGLSNMRARAEELSGSFQLESEPGKGTAIRLTLPYS